MPVRRPDDSPQPNNPSNPESDAWCARVLIVDDDPMSAHILEESVRDCGHNPTVARSWTAAIRSFGEESFDLVLMDAIMPGVDGFKLTKMFRDRSQSYVPIVFVTGLNDRRARERGIEAGADDFIIKPVSTLELRVRMSAMLRIRRLTAELEKKSLALQRLALVDALTGLDNRRSLTDKMELEIPRARRYERPLSLVVIDIDHFKQINDRYGHPTGDEVLVYLSNVLKQQTLESGTAFRFGGEEFVVAFPEHDLEQAKQRAEAIRTAISAQEAHAEVGVITASLGVACSARLPDTFRFDDLFALADEALYQAKGSGRNRVCVAGEHASANEAQDHQAVA